MPRLRARATIPLCLALLGCTPPGSAPGAAGLPPLGPRHYLMQDVAIIGLPAGQTLPEAALAVQRRFGAGEPVEGAYSETLQSRSLPDGRALVVLAQNGLADDLVRAVQHVVQFELRPDPRNPARSLAVATAYGTRQKCARAADPDAWTSAPCP